MKKMKLGLEDPIHPVIFFTGLGVFLWGFHRVYNKAKEAKPGRRGQRQQLGAQHQHDWPWGCP